MKSAGQFVTLFGVMIVFAAVAFGPLHTDRETRRQQFFLLMLGVAIFCSSWLFRNLLSY